MMSKIKKLLFGLLLDKIRQEIKFHDYPVKNRTLLDYERSLFGQGAILQFFQRRDPNNLVQNWKPTLWSALEEIRLEIIFNDHLIKNRALLDYKKGLFGQMVILEFLQTEDPMNLVQN